MNCRFGKGIGRKRLLATGIVALAATLSLSGCGVKFDQGAPELPARSAQQVARDSAADLQEAILKGSEKLASEQGNSEAQKKALNRLAEVSKKRLQVLGGVWNPWPDKSKFPNMKLPEPKRPAPITSSKELLQALALCQAQGWADANNATNNDLARSLASVAIGCQFSAADMASLWGVSNPTWPKVSPSKADPGTNGTGRDKSEFANSPSQADQDPEETSDNPAGASGNKDAGKDAKASAEGSKSDAKKGYTKAQADAAGKILADIDSLRAFMIRYRANNPSGVSQSVYDYAFKLEQFTNIIAAAGATDVRQPAYKFPPGLTLNSSEKQVWDKVQVQLFICEFNLLGELNRPEFDLTNRLYDLANQLRAQGYDFGDMPGLMKK